MPCSEKVQHVCLTQFSGFMHLGAARWSATSAVAAVFAEAPESKPGCFIFPLLTGRYGVVLLDEFEKLRSCAMEGLLKAWDTGKWVNKHLDR